MLSFAKASSIVALILLAVAYGVTASPPSLRQISKDINHIDVGISKRDSFEEWCDPVLGCLNITDGWYSAGRPINVLPDTREKINTRFYLHTRGEPNVDVDYIISADDLTSLLASPFDPAKPTKFISHGFIDTGDTRWLKDMAAAFLSYGDYNVIRVDWGDGSLPMYYQATANTRVAGLEIGYLVNTLATSEYKLDATLVHCIGHSLGSHVCGYAGEQIPTLARISGLDPAGPYFTGTATFVRLDPSDATFVDNIHTDADSIFLLGYGTGQPMGNIDFMPNSGHDQPGCDPASIAIDLITIDMVDASREVFACSHIRAINYFQDTLVTSSCQWLAHNCYDYNSFEAGECFSCDDDNSKCAYAGIRADEYVDKTRELAMFYLDTDPNGNQPYCEDHYQVSILTAYPKEAESWVMGHLKITVYGDNGNIIEKEQITSDHERIDHGQIKDTLFINHLDVGDPISLELKWVYDDKVINPGTYCWMLICNKSLYVQSVELSSINYYPETERLTHTHTYCSMDGSTTEIKSGNTKSFVINEYCTPLDGH